MSLLETEVPIQNVITMDPEKAKALENDTRAKILDMLADAELTIEDIHDELTRRGETKAETTVRHHVNILKNAGLVELARLEDAGGAAQKYYKSNTRVFSYELPADADETLADASESVRTELAELVEGVIAKHGAAIETIAKELKPCAYCTTQHYEEFIIRELLNRALTDLSEADELDDVFHA